MASKEEDAGMQRGSPAEQHGPPKKRRKVNHGTSSSSRTP